MSTAKSSRQSRKSSDSDFQADEYSLCGRPDKGSYGEALSVGTGVDTFDQYDTEIGSRDSKRQFELARNWSGTHWYVAPIIAAKATLVGYKASVRLPEDAVLDESEENQTREECRQFIQAAIREWLTQDAVVVTWRRDNPGRVTFVRPEVIEYSDAGGIEVFTVIQNIPQTVLKALPPETRARYQSGKVTFGGTEWQEFNSKNPDKAEGFRVLKRAPRGHGLGSPMLRSVFRALGQSDSMEAGEGAYAFAGRRVLRMHKLGFEPKPNMPASAGAMQYTEKRAKAVYNKAKGRVGGWEQVVPFDYKYETAWQDQKPYAVEKWGTVADRLRTWAGPIGAVMDARSVNPDLMQLLRSQCEGVRDELRFFLQEVLRQAYGWKTPPRISFGNACFTSQRLFFELLRYAHTAGPVSGPTLLENLFGGEAIEQEKDRKGYERKNREDFLPTYDASHGTEPGLEDPDGKQPSTARGRRASGKPPLSNPGGRTAG
jgi:hypothetical protein